ncbi:MAG: hypothetical protein AB1390_12000, partial [Nitrospirota bacterium]
MKRIFDLFSKSEVVAVLIAAIFIINIKTSSASDLCASFDFAANTLHVPCFNLDGTSFWLDLGLVSSDSIMLGIKNFGVNGTPVAAGCATFDFPTAVLQIPCFYFEGINFCLDLSLVSGEPILLGLAGFDQTGVNRVGGTWFGSYSSNLIPWAETEFGLTQSCTFFTGLYMTISDSYFGVIEENDGVVYGMIAGRAMGKNVSFTLNQTISGCAGVFNSTGSVNGDNMQF